MFQEIIAGYLIEQTADATWAALKKKYDPLAKRAWSLTADQLAQKYGEQFTAVWGSKNFVEMIPSLGTPELLSAIESARQGEWTVNEEQIAQAISIKLAEHMPQIVDHARELVCLFFNNFTDLLKENDPSALQKRIYVRQEEIIAGQEELNVKLTEIHRGVQKLEARFQQPQSLLQSLGSTVAEVALKDELSRGSQSRF